MKKSYILNWWGSGGSIWSCKILPKRKTNHPFSRSSEYQLCKYIECLYRDDLLDARIAEKGMQVWEKDANVFRTFEEAKKELKRRMIPDSKSKPNRGVHGRVTYRPSWGTGEAWHGGWDE